LHDDLQQLLLAAKLRLRPLLDADPVQLEEHIERIEELLDECMAASRNLSHELSPSVLQQGTLDKVVEWLGEWFSEKHGLNVAVDTPGELPPTPDHLRVFLFQAIRELLFNVVKHSGNQEARVRLAPQEGCLTIQVEDDGDGFDPSSVERRLHDPEGFGLFNIRERLEALLGRLEIQRATSGGACFRLVIPLAKNTESV